MYNLASIILIGYVSLNESEVITSTERHLFDAWKRYILFGFCVCCGLRVANVGDQKPILDSASFLIFVGQNTETNIQNIGNQIRQFIGFIQLCS